jgi:hypothetical protein
MSTRIRLLAVVSASALAVGFGGQATAAGAAGLSQTPPPKRSEPPKVDELLERFPLGTATLTETKPAVAPPDTPPAITIPPVDDSGNDLAPTAIGAVLAVLLGMAAAGVLLVRRRQPRPAAIWETTPSLALLYETLAMADGECNKLKEDYSRGRSAAVTEVSQDREEPQPGEPEQPGGVTSEARESDSADSLEHGGVVEHISAILQSAEVAAAAIRAEAVANAEEISQAAAEEGRKHLAKVQEEASKIRSDAEEEASRIRHDAQEAAGEAQSAAESYGANQRSETEQRVQHMLAQAEAQARATRQAAEEMARQIEETARQREEMLRAQMHPLETSLRRALDGFRGISKQLEDLLDGDASREDETLVEALSEPVRRSGEWEEGPPQQERTNG